MKRAPLPGLVLMGMIAVAGTGCAFKGEQLHEQRAGEAAQAWRPLPVQVRVHPATRFAMHNGEPVLEARIELLDAMLDSVKGSGTFRLELLDAAGPTSPRGGQQLYIWDLSLMTLDDQQLHYDPVTRAYYFPLRLDNFAVAERPTLLRVTVTPAGAGQRMTAEYPMRP